MEDRFSNYLNVSYPTSSRWDLTDRHGRLHQVNFRTSAPGLNQVSSVVLKAFNGTTATYTFSYADTVIDRYPKDDDPTTSTTVSVPLLTGVTLPDSSTYSMPVASSYYTTSYDSGLVKKLGLPTGGSIEYTYQEYKFWTHCVGEKPEEGPEQVLYITNRNQGVASRTFRDASGASLGQWTYETDRYWIFDGAVCTRDLERVTKVRAPSGDAVVYYFEMDWKDGWPYGLPYSEFQADGNFRLSVEYFDDDATIECDPFDVTRCTTTGTRKRSLWVGYDKDTVPGSGYGTLAFDTNRRVAAEKTVYLDDLLPDQSYRAATNDYSGFDGLGHYRTATTGGTFDSGNARTTTTQYNPNNGTYPGSFTPPSAGTAWVLNTYTETKVTEGTNNERAKAQACFNTSTGFLLGTRTLKQTGTAGNDPSPHANDLIVRYSQDGMGNVSYEEYFGGDTQSIGTGDLCDLLINQLSSSDAQYWLAHTYQYGSRRTSRYLQPNGTPLSFYTLDLDIDPNTGLVKKSRDVAGIETAFEYDALGRMTWAKPTTGNGAWIENAYYPYGSDYARVETYRRPNGSTTGVLARKSLRFDHLGRPFLEKQLVPDTSCGTPPCWNQRKTSLDAMGRTVWQSEWYLNGTADGSMKKTEYVDYDPFGRPLEIRLPDYPSNSSHKITFAYHGVHDTARTTSVATAAGSESTSTTAEIYDRQGRLWRVTEPSGTGGADINTTHSYDVGGRLSGVSTAGAVTQTRSFTYDNRGFLLSEVVPEVGSTGGGTRTYSKYDARGHLGRYQDGLHDIAYDYDQAERLTLAAQSDASGNPDASKKLKELTYATANGTNNWKLGKLETAIAHNWTGAPETDTEISETYTYGGTAGRVSQRQTSLEGRTITQAFTWNDLGVIASLGYPDDSQLDNATQEPARTVSYTYSNGFLTAIPSFATSISYHVNTMPNRIAHANAVNVDHTIDPDNVRRPRQIALSNAIGSWSYGNYAYDGAGNIKAIGSDTYIYDKVSRLTSGTLATASCGAKSQTATYNPFGYMTSTTTTDWATQTFQEAANGLYNRISGVGYDAAGNVTTWSGFSYTWNRLNQMLTATSGASHTFLYTADGERASDRVGASKTLTIRDLSNKLLRVYTYNGTSWSWSKDYVYRDGQLLATVEPPFASQVVKHLHLDHLGTPRRVTNSSRTIIATHDYYPFGMEACGTADNERMKLTGHERDLQGTSSQTDDLDYMHQRFYNPNVARFVALDVVGGRPAVPQSWNKCSYALGNPLAFADPDGRDVWDFIKKGASNPRVRSAASFAAAALAENAARELPPGKARGVALLAASALALDSAVNSAAAATGSFIAAATVAETGVGVAVGATVGAGFATLTYVDLKAATQYAARGLENIREGTDPADKPQPPELLPEEPDDTQEPPPETPDAPAVQMPPFDYQDRIDASHRLTGWGTGR